MPTGRGVAAPDGSVLRFRSMEDGLNFRAGLGLHLHTVHKQGGTSTSAAARRELLPENTVKTP